MVDKNVEIRLKDVRISFVNVFTPQEFVDEETGNRRYSQNLNALVPKRLANGDPNPLVVLLQEAMRQAIANQWGDNKPSIPAERRCFRDGEPKDPDTDERVPLYEGYEGHCFLSANKAVAGPDGPLKVVLIDSRKGPDGKFPRLKEADGKLYSGCFADIIVRIYGYDGSKKKVPHRVNASLEAVKFVRHGEAFGAKPVDVDNAFDEEAAEDGFDNPSTSAKGSASSDDDMMG